MSFGTNVTFELAQVSPDSLLLDPRNPRLFVDDSEYICDEHDDFAQKWIQEELLNALQSNRHHKLNELMHSIRTKGFEPFSDIYVYEYGGHFLVFEGNRRTASIKTLLRDEESGLEPEVRESLEWIPVKILQCKESDREDIISKILTTLHLNSSLQWQPMQQAFQYYQMYLKELQSRRGARNGTFEVKNYYINKLADHLGRQRKHVVPELQVYCLYKQFRDHDYAIDGTMYSMLKEVLSKRTLCEQYFEFDYTTYEMSESGLEYLYYICLDKGRPVSEPRQVGVLHKCASLNRYDLINSLAEQETDIHTVKEQIQAIAEEGSYERSLTKIEKEFSRMILKTELSAEELRLAQKIIKHAKQLEKTLSQEC